MYDDLNRIESVYGSVPEYYRDKWEGDIDYQEPSQKESLISDRKYKLYLRQLDFLSGVPSDTAKNLLSKWNEFTPKQEDFINSNNSYSDKCAYLDACEKFAKNKLFDCIDALNNKYHINISKEQSCYSKQVGKLGISIEYIDNHSMSGNVQYLNVSELDLTTFKNVYRDLKYLGFNITMHLTYAEDCIKHVTGCSLGELRKNYLKEIERRNKLLSELKRARLDEKSNADYLSLKSDVMACDSKDNMNSFNRSSR